jgi:hypothetical protein
VTSSPSTTAGPSVPTSVTTSIDTGSTDATTTGPAVVGVYVHAAFGADSNPGTIDEPARTVQQGVALAAAQGLGVVYVAAGDYAVASDANDVVEVVAGISILGGYAPDDWSVRDSTTFVSRIVDQAVAAAGFNAANPHRAVYVGPGVGAETLLDGLTIAGSVLANSAAIVVDASAPQIIDCALLGGGGSYSTGVYIRGGSPSLFNNTIDGVGSEAPQPAFAVRGVDCAPTIHGNVLRSGGGTSNRAVFLSGCAGVVSSSVVVAERGLGGSSRALELLDSTTAIVSNTIAIDTEALGYYVIALGAAAPSVLSSNNFVAAAGTTWCYGHTEAIDVPSVHNNNFGCSNMYSGSAVFNSIVELENGHADAADNVDVEPGVVDPANDWHLRTDGSTLCAVARGGIDVGLADGTDADGMSRTPPWSMGAYELDSACL